MKKWECLVCGYIHEGDAPPDECPICGAGKDQFVEVKEAEETRDQTATAGSPSPAGPEPQQPVSEEAQPAEAPFEDAPAQPQTPATLLDRATGLIIEHHLHPIAVHSPNGIIPVAFIFLLLTLMFQSTPLDKAAFYNLIVVLFTMPLVLFTGYTAWQIQYRGAKTSVFKMKITASIVATAILFILVIWRAAQPDVMTTPSAGRWIFLILAVVLLAAVGTAGHLGGKLVFGSRQ